MRDYDSVDLIGWEVFQQSRQGRISQVEYESKAILLNQEAAARLTCGGPRSAGPQNSHPHRSTLGDEGDGTSGTSWWGRLDSNQRPTDYERKGRASRLTCANSDTSSIPKSRFEIDTVFRDPRRDEM
jgi:hypothetical protein